MTRTDDSYVGLYDRVKIANENNIPLMVDCAQSAGTIDIDVNRDNISLLAFAGHKSVEYGYDGYIFAEAMNKDLLDYYKNNYYVLFEA